MMSKHILHAINSYLMELMDTDKIFGGKVILLSGDFRQTMPIIPNANMATIIGSSIISSDLFKDNFQFLSLTKNMRAENAS
jgi:ATP-dependent DNA helicase PIF1